MPIQSPQPFPAYVGTEPFVFVCYSHRDTEQVYAEIAKWNDQGYRVWYDEGIPLGKVWRREIKHALETCALFVLFVSESSMKSEDVLDEITGAIRLRIPLLPVFLEDAMFAEEVELRLSRIQHIRKHELSEDTYRRKIQEALAQASGPIRKPVLPPFERIWSNSKDGPEMILIPAGSFIRGNGKFDWEQPQKTIHLDAYRIGKYPVTVKQYRQFCNETRRPMPIEPNRGLIDNHPITNVTWHDAAAYCVWSGLSLPTEAEWEKAARGTDGRKYPWIGGWSQENCRCAKKGLGYSESTAPVGSYPTGASPYGCLDMAGNVWEWCNDWFDKSYYSVAPDKNPIGAEIGTDRVIRGGAWSSYLSVTFRASNRDRYDPDSSNYDIGFRCVFRSD